MPHTQHTLYCILPSVKNFSVAIYYRFWLIMQGHQRRQRMFAKRFLCSLHNFLKVIYLTENKYVFYGLLVNVVSTFHYSRFLQYTVSCFFLHTILYWGKLPSLFLTECPGFIRQSFGRIGKNYTSYVFYFSRMWIWLVYHFWAKLWSFEFLNVALYEGLLILWGPVKLGLNTFNLKWSQHFLTVKIYHMLTTACSGCPFPFWMKLMVQMWRSVTWTLINMHVKCSFTAEDILQFPCVYALDMYLFARQNLILVNCGIG